VLFFAPAAPLERGLEPLEAERLDAEPDPEREALDRELLLLAERALELPLDRELELPEPPVLLARVPLARLLLARVPLARLPLARVPLDRELLLDRVARVFAALFAESLRASALRLRVRAAFLAASSRFAGPPVARSSSVSARARSSLAVFRSAPGALLPVSFAIVAASATLRATFLRTPPARTAL